MDERSHVRKNEGFGRLQELMGELVEGLAATARPCPEPRGCRHGGVVRTRA